jgi:hypothetical protein
VFPVPFGYIKKFIVKCLCNVCLLLYLLHVTSLFRLCFHLFIEFIYCYIPFVQESIDTLGGEIARLTMERQNAGQS